MELVALIAFNREFLILREVKDKITLMNCSKTEKKEFINFIAIQAREGRWEGMIRVGGEKNPCVAN